MERHDKTRAFARLLERVRADLEEVARSQRAAQDGATHAEMRAEGPKDMRSTEAGYLARGLAERAEALGEAVRLLEGFAAPAFAEGDAIAPGALVSVEDDAGAREHYLIVPAGGGERIAAGDLVVQTLTPSAPLGRLLLGRRTGEVVEAKLPRGRRELEILGIA